MKKKVRLSKNILAIISIFFGYLGIDQFILNNKKRGFQKLSAFLISFVILNAIDQVTNFIINTTTYSINFSRTLLQFIGAKSFILQHFPRIIGLLALTLLVFIGLILTLTILIWWIEDIIKILNKE